MKKKILDIEDLHKLLPIKANKFDKFNIQNHDLEKKPEGEEKRYKQVDVD